MTSFNLDYTIYSTYYCMSPYRFRICGLIRMGDL